MQNPYCLDTKMDDVLGDVRELKTRVTNVEQQLASLSATMAGNYVSTSSRFDRLEMRVERIERRLELTTH
jgi:phage shock protein A